MKYYKRYRDEDDWFEITESEILDHTENTGYWKPNTVLKMLNDGLRVHTPFAEYKKALN